MVLSVVVAGATGWTGSAVVAAILKSDDLRLAGAVARSAAGRDAGEAIGLPRAGVIVSPTLAEALRAPSDIVVDYTKPDAVKAHVLLALEEGRNVVVGTSGLSAADYGEIDAAARAAGRGVVAAGNFSITATLLKRFALEAARYVADVEVIDYAHASKPDTPSGTARELAEALAAIEQVARSAPRVSPEASPRTGSGATGTEKRRPTTKPVAELVGIRETRGAAIGEGTPVQVHSLRLPSFVIACEAIFGAPDERLTIRHDAGTSAAPYVAGTLLAVRRVGEQAGLRRGLDSLL
jgi:4-hydroxy-tetrahydrodipicolinate reductase